MVNKVNRIEKRKLEFYQLKSEAGIGDWISKWWNDRKTNRDSRSMARVADGYRSSIRRFCKETYKDFHDIEDHLTNRSQNGVAEAVSLVSQISIEFLDLFAEDMDGLLGLYPKNPNAGHSDVHSPSGNDQAGMSEEWSDMRDLIEKFIVGARPIIEKEPQEVRAKIESKIGALENKLIAVNMLDDNADKNKLNKLRSEVISMYKEIEAEVSNLALHRHSATTFSIPKTSQHLINFEKRNEEIAKIAHNVITRWINRKLMGINRTDRRRRNSPAQW